MIHWTGPWLVMLAVYGAAWASFWAAGRARGKRFVDPRLLEWLGDEGAALLQLRLSLEVLLFAIALFVPCRSGWALFFGIGPMVVGGALMIAAARSRAIQEGPLLTEGPYAYSRHPILAGRAVFLVGLLLMGVGDNTAYALFVVVALATLLVHDRWVEREEAWLEHCCHEEFAEHRRWTPRYLICP